MDVAALVVDEVVVDLGGADELVRCRDDGRPAEEIPIEGWSEALDEARRLIAATL